MKINKANNRDKKRHKAKHGMIVNGKSIFIIQGAIIGKKRKK